MLTWAKGKSRKALVSATVFLAFLTLPSTVNFFVRIRGLLLARLEKDEIEVLNYLQLRSAPGTVVLCPPQTDKVVTALTHCRTPITPGLYTANLVGRDELHRRTDDREAFWASWNNGQTRRDLLARYGVDYLVVGKNASHACRAARQAVALTRVYVVVLRMKPSEFIWCGTTPSRSNCHD